MLFCAISSSMEFNIRKIIKEEFTTLIIPYQQELHNSVDTLEYKINNNINQIKSLNMKNISNFDDNSLNIITDPKDNNNKYILRVEYDNKMMELEHQISSLNSFFKAIKDTLDNNSMANNNNNYLEKDEFAQKVDQIQNKFDILIKEN